MSLTPSKLMILAAGAMTLGALATPAVAAPMQVSANLTSSAEVPPNQSPGKGELSGTYDPATKKFDFTVTYSGLTGPATMAHLHAPAPTGKNAGIEIPIKGTIESPIKGDYTLTADQAKNLTDGMTYFNIHTKKNPGGELRGQILTH